MQERQSFMSGNGTESAVRAHRDKTFAAMFRSNELVWQVDEVYYAEEGVWRVDFLRQDLQGVWMLYRYHYDIATGVVYFMGVYPVDEMEMLALRRKGKVFAQHQTTPYQ